MNFVTAIEANFAEKYINNYYKIALDELQLTPINQASIDNLKFQEGLDHSFSARIEVETEII